MAKYVAYKSWDREPYRLEHNSAGDDVIMDAVYLGSERQLEDFFRRSDNDEWTIRKVGAKIIDNGRVVL